MDRPALLNAHAKLLAFDLLSLSPTPFNPATFKCHGVIVSRVEILGVVTSRDHKPGKFLKFTIDDGTGCVECILWLNQLNSPYFSRRNPPDVRLIADMARSQATEIKIGAVARVRGKVGKFRGVVQVTVSDAAVERDPNAEILHWLECLRLARRCYDVKAAKRK